MRKEKLIQNKVGFSKNLFSIYLNFSFKDNFTNTLEKSLQKHTQSASRTQRRSSKQFRAIFNSLTELLTLKPALPKRQLQMGYPDLMRFTREQSERSFK